MRQPAKSSLTSLGLELCSPSHFRITLWYKAGHNEVVIGLPSEPTISSLKKVTKIREYPSLWGNNFIANPVVCSQLLHNQVQLQSPGPSDNRPSHLPKQGWIGWLVVARHCLGAVFNREQTACEVFSHIYFLKCWNCHLTARKRNYGTSGLIGKLGHAQHPECRDRPPKRTPRMTGACQ